jgi:hypothetical protein
MKHAVYNPYGLKDQASFLRFARLVIYGGCGAGLFVFFFIYQVLVANSAPSWLSLTVYYLSEAVTTAALFATLALIAIAITREEWRLVKRLLWEEIASLFLLSFLLRILLYLFTAFIDSTGILGGFYLNDVTLSYLVDAYAFNLIMRAVSVLFGVATMLAVVLLSTHLIKKQYQKGVRGKITDAHKKLPLIVYLAVSIGFALVNTVMTVIDLGVALKFSIIFSLILPYVEIGVLTLIGQYVIEEVVKHFENN